MYSACSGMGAFLNGGRVKTLNPGADLESSLIATGFAYSDRLDEGLKKVLEESEDVMRFGSAALDICHVVAGNLGAFYECGLKPWDIAAGMLMVQEQGGSVSDISGNPIDIFSKD